MASPLALVEYIPETGQFAVGEEAVALVRNVTCPLAIVAVYGWARQGKSYLLDMLIDRPAAESQVGATVTTRTKGLWMWSAPIHKTTSDGREYCLVLLDAEGIDACDQTSTQIFTLAVLLSSFLVYNEVQSIDESSIERLALVTKLTKEIQEEYLRDTARHTSSDFAPGDFAPSFLWLIPDACLQLQENGQQVTPKQHMDSILSSENHDEAKGQLRNSIKFVFPDRDCFILAKPVLGEDGLRGLHQVPVERRLEDFVQGATDLKNLILDKIKPKRIEGQPVTGPIFAGLVGAYARAMNGEAMPQISSTWQGVVACIQACDSAVDAYKDKLRTSVAWEALDDEHERCLAWAKSVFDSHAVGDAHIRLEYENRFRNVVATCFAQYKAEASAKNATADVRNLLALGLLGAGVLGVPAICVVWYYGSSIKQKMGELASSTKQQMGVIVQVVGALSISIEQVKEKIFGAQDRGRGEARQGSWGDWRKDLWNFVRDAAFTLSFIADKGNALSSLVAYLLPKALVPA